MAIYRVTISGRLFGQLCQNVLHFRRLEPPNTAKQELAQAIIDAWLGQVLFACRNVMTWHEVKVVSATNPNDLPVILPTNKAGFQGGNTAIWPPMCGVYQIKTAIPGRRGHGRYFLSGVEPQGLTDGRWNTNQTNQFNSIANSLKGNFLGSNPGKLVNLGLLRRNGGEADFIEATDFKIRDYPGSQVRRNFFRGQ